MENIEFARLLMETADLMEIAGEDGFRVRSYRNAAAALEGYPERVEDLLRDPDRKVTEIPGIGKAMADHLGEAAQRGSFERRDELMAKIPPTALEMLKIQGLGPKSIAVLLEALRITTLDDLEKAAREQRLRALPRMGAKLEEKVLRSIAAYRQSKGRFLLNFGASVASDIEGYLADKQSIHQIQPAGSLRRGRETVGDIDILVSTTEPEAVLRNFTKHPRVTEVLGHGENKASVRFGLEGIQVDMRALPEESYGAGMMYFTGSKNHNVALRQRALKMGYTLNEYGLFQLDTERRVAGRTEEEIYRELGLPWIAPEIRESLGEIEAALEGRLPSLVEAGDIRGDVHMHTIETDGRATLEEMAALARDRGYDYIAITDHSKALAMANGLDEARAIAFGKRVKDLNRAGELGIRVFSGIECDIRRDGTMDLDNDALAALDVVIGSVHSFMNLEPAEMTDRLLAAIENPHVSIIGHPTGRILLHREGYPFDFDKVARAAAEHGVALEVNASPERLDLHSTLLRSAKAKGVKFVVSTDAHHPKHLSNITFGVLTARRGWLEKADVLNTQPAGPFLASLRPNRKT